MSLFTQRLISKKACYMQCRKAFNQRSYGTATLPHSVERTGNEDSSSISSSSALAGTRRAPKDRGTNLNDNAPTTAPMIHSKIQAYLDEVENTSVTVQDLERLKPDNYGKPGTPQYEKDYNSLLDNILRCFNATQLRHFAKLYKVPSGKRAAKRDHAVAIIEHAWKLPSLAKVRKQEKDSNEVARREFVLDPSQCFLLLGKDGSYLHDLSSKYNVHVSLSAAPLRLHVEGAKSALDNLAEHITSFKEDIDSQLFDIGNAKSMSDELLYRISRKSGAFTQYINKQQLSITYRKSNSSAFGAAKRLLTMAIAEQQESTSMLLYRIAEEAESTFDSARRSYASYPFIPPYTHSRYSTRSLFRIRNVKNSAAHKAEDAEKLIEMPNVTDVQTQRVSNLQDRLLDALHMENTPSGFTRVTKATPGHLLWSSSKANARLVPDLAKASPFEEVAKWISNHHVSSIFFPSSPTLVLSTPAKHQKILRRLTYISSLPSELTNVQNVTFEIILNSKSYPPIGNTWSEDNLSHESDLLKPVCRINADVVTDLMLPDRTMDIRFSLTDSALLMRSGWPAQLEEYYNNLKIFLSSSQEVPQPDIPLGFRYKDSEFILQSSDTVRQSLKSVQSGVDDTKLDVITEIITSTEDNESTRTLSQIECTDLSDASWKQFLQSCILLTTH